MNPGRDPQRIVRAEDGSPDGRAFTILELLIALTLLLALVALVAPALLARLAPATADALVAQVHAASLEAQALARRTGAPVAVLLNPGADGLWSLSAQTLPPPDHDQNASPAPPPAARTLLVLPQGFTPDPPQRETDPATDEPEPLRLALFFPDGSATAADPVALAAPDGSRYTLSVRRWLGAATLQRVPDEPEPAHAGTPEEALP